jgi:hypothetical protein
VTIFLRRHANAKLTDAATALQVRTPTLNSSVNDLVRTRWVTKHRSVTDTRAVCLSPSRRGKARSLQVEHRVRHVETTLTEFAYLLWLYAHQCAHTTANAILADRTSRREL